MVGVGLVVKGSNARTRVVVAAGVVAVVYPARVAVTVTERVLPTSAATGVYAAEVPTGVVVPERFHEYAKVAPDAHVPVLAVNVLPTCAVPVIVGAAALPKTPAMTSVVGTLVTEASALPVREAVTVRVRDFPKSVATGV
jgi:hypothetical protein